MSELKAGELKAAALAYAAKGLHVFPCWWAIKTDAGLACGCGDPECKSQGKHPISRLDWTKKERNGPVPNGHKDATTNGAHIALWWDAFPKANIGLSLDKSYLAAVDVDPRNGGDATMERLESEHGLIDSTWRQHTGSGGYHLFFQCPPDVHLPGKLGNGVDLKHHGYVIVSPSATGGDYWWVDCSGPLESDEFPSLLPEWIAKLAQTLHVQPVLPSDAIGFEWMGEDGRAELCDAMAAIPNWDRDQWLRMGMVLHMLDPNPAGYGYHIWEWWSQLNNSADGDGSRKFDAQDQARVWHSFTRKKEISLHRESIFFWAKERGWKSRLDLTVESQVDRIMEAMENGPAIQLQTDIHEGEFPMPCPVPLIEDMAAVISQNGQVFYREASLLGALAVAATATARRFIGEDGSTTNLYFGLSATSINELRYVATGVETILADAGLRRLTRTTRFHAASALYRALFMAPALTYISSEWETLLRFARRQPSGVTEHVLNLLADLYSRKDLQIDSADEAGLKKLTQDAQPVIRNPSLSMVALLSSECWEVLSKTQELGRGATELLFIVSCRPDDIREHAHPQIPTPQWLVEHIRRVRGIQEPQAGDMNLDQIFQEMPDARPILMPVRFELPPESFDSRLATLTDRRAFRPLIQGARVIIRRLCVVLAAWNYPEHPIATRAIVEWCGEYVIHHVRIALQHIQAMANDGQVDPAQKVLAKLIDAGKWGMTARDLVRNVRCFKSLSAADRLELLDQMEQDEDIVAGTPNGKKGKRYVARQFVATGTPVLPSAKDEGATGEGAATNSAAQDDQVSTLSTGVDQGVSTLESQATQGIQAGVDVSTAHTGKIH